MLIFMDIAFDDPTLAVFLENRILAQRLFVVGDPKPVGYSHFDIAGGCAYIEEIYVDPDHAGQRLSALLIDSIAALALSRSLEALLLSTFKDLPWKAPYYRKLGFAKIPDAILRPALLAIRKEHVERGLDETKRIFMRRALPQNPDV